MKIILYLLAFIGVMFLLGAFGIVAMYVMISALISLVVSFWPVILILIIVVCLLK